MDNTVSNIILFTDGYKLDHRRQYPTGTEYVYANFTPRSCKYFPHSNEGVVFFGLQYFIKEYLINKFNQDFFNKPWEELEKAYKYRLDSYLGKHSITTDHIKELHELGYLPLRIKALPEGSLVSINVPCLTIINTDKRFFWLVNYLETLISNILWMPITSATTARVYKKELHKHINKTSTINKATDFLCHDFSMRGMAGMEATVTSGMAHLTSFIGTESIPSMEAVEKYYNMDGKFVAGTVPATEHSVMCSGGYDTEYETFKRLITEVYPEGFVSIVSDTWDFWKVITEYLPKLKDVIMSRDGRLVIRPDSGDPVDIICGSGKPAHLSSSPFHRGTIHQWDGIMKPSWKGAYECLWEIFGGTVNEKGYKELDSHIGIIYGDSITIERQKEIYKRLEEKGFSASNLVLGIGSYTYQYVTRDTFGQAMKTTWVQINGEGKEIFKNPKTDDGTKVSRKGLMKVNYVDGKYEVEDQVSKEEESKGCLEVVFENGKLLKEYSLEDVRKNVNNTL